MIVDGTRMAGPTVRGSEGTRTVGRYTKSRRLGGPEIAGGNSLTFGYVLRPVGIGFGRGPHTSRAVGLPELFLVRKNPWVPQILTVKSRHPVAARFPSGLKTACGTSEVCPGRTPSSRPFSEVQRRTVPSNPVVRSARPSALKVENHAGYLIGGKLALHLFQLSKRQGCRTALQRTTLGYSGDFRGTLADDAVQCPRQSELRLPYRDPMAAAWTTNARRLRSSSRLNSGLRMAKSPYVPGSKAVPASPRDVSGTPASESRAPNHNAAKLPLTVRTPTHSMGA